MKDAKPTRAHLRIISGPTSGGHATGVLVYCPTQEGEEVDQDMREALKPLTTTLEQRIDRIAKVVPGKLRHGTREARKYGLALIIFAKGVSLKRGLELARKQLSNIFFRLGPEYREYRAHKKAARQEAKRLIQRELAERNGSTTGPVRPAWMTPGYAAAMAYSSHQRH